MTNPNTLPRLLRLALETPDDPTVLRRLTAELIRLGHGRVPMCDRELAARDFAPRMFPGISADVWRWCWDIVPDGAADGFLRAPLPYSLSPEITNYPLLLCLEIIPLDMESGPMKGVSSGFCSCCGMPSLLRGTPDVPLSAAGGSWIVSFSKWRAGGPSNCPRLVCARSNARMRAARSARSLPPPFFPSLAVFAFAFPIASPFGQPDQSPDKSTTTHGRLFAL